MRPGVHLLGDIWQEDNANVVMKISPSTGEKRRKLLQKTGDRQSKDV
jgi:hypothetical protein